MVWILDLSSKTHAAQIYFGPNNANNQINQNKKQAKKKELTRSMAYHRDRYGSRE